jgi:uncharacterized membrane protein YccC
VKKQFRTHIVQATQVAPVRPAYAAGLRAAIATVGPLVAGSLLGWPDAAWMGLAGFNVALGDKGGSLRTRLGAMLPAAFFGAIAVSTGAIAGRHPISAVVVFALFAIAAGVARSYGQAAIGIGVLSVATLVVSMEQPAPTFAAAMQRGLAVLAGAAFAIALSLLLGRFRLYRPARLAVARVYRDLAALANGGSAPTLATDIDAARRTLTQLRRGLQGESPRGERLLLLLESGDRMATLIDPGQHRECAPLLLAIADAVEHERSAASLENRATGSLRDPLTSALNALRELEKGGDADPSRVPFRAQYVDPIRGVLTPQSAVLRHALRVAVAGGIAAAFTRSLHIERGYWLTLTVVVVLQPYTSSTLQRGLQRVSGTIAGAIVAALLLSIVHTPTQMMLVVFIGAAFTVALLPVNYGLFSFVLTPTFILLAEVHAVDRHLVWLRLSNTLLGALLAWLAAWLLWPASERGRVRDDLAAALHALAELTRCTAECDDALIADARSAFFVAVENAAASLQRLLSDSGKETDATEEAMMAILVYARRHANALAENDDRLALAPHAREASTLLHELANATAEHRAPQAKDASRQLNEPLAGMQSAVTRLAA